MADVIEILADIHAEDVDEQRPARQRTLTAKGLEYTLQCKRKRLEQLSSALGKIGDECMILMDSGTTQLETLQKKRKHWHGLYDEFLVFDAEYRKLMSPVKIDEYEADWFNQRNDFYTELRTTLQEWLAKQVKEEQRLQDDVNSSDSSISEIGLPQLYKYAHSDHASIVSSRSRSSSIVSARIVQEQRKAELQVKKAALQQKMEIQKAQLELQQQEEKYKEQLEMSRLKLHMQQEEIKLEEELAINDAHSRVLDELDKSTASGFTRRKPLSTVKYDIEPNVSRNLYVQDPAPGERQPLDSHLLSIVRHLTKPASEIRKFSGNPLEYQQFKRQFKTRILDNCDSYDERLNYLEQYTTGDPHKIVSGYSYLDAQKGYTAAMKELDERYGDPDIIVDAFVKKALDWPNIKNDSPKDLDDFSIFLAECEHAVQDMDSLKILEYSENFRKIVSKLPYFMHDKWRSLVQQRKEKGKRPLFADLVQLVRREARKASDPSFGKDALTKPQQPARHGTQKQRSAGSFAAKAESPNKTADKESLASPRSVIKPSSYAQPCFFCKGAHAMEACKNIEALPFLERTDFLKNNGLCFGCLRYGHHRRNCRIKSTCRTCQGRHPTILHVDGPIPTRYSSVKTAQGPAPASTISGACSDVQCSFGSDQPESPECTMAIIPVKVRAKGSNLVVETYAFLDSGSNVSFCAEQLMYKLGLEGKRMRLEMETMGTPHTLHTYELKGLEILDMDEQNVIPLPPVYTKDRMPVSKDHIPTPEDLSQWTHLADICLPQIKADVGLLVGNNVPDTSTPLEVRVGPRGSPYASKSLLGWIPWNILRYGKNSTSVTNRDDVIAIQQLHDIKDLNDLYVKTVGLDYPERIIDDIREHSQEDKLFLNKMQASQRQVDGHYEYELPYRDPDLKLPDNQYLAKQRLVSLKRKFARDQEYFQHYQDFMEKLIHNDHAEEVPESELLRSDGETWYLPHHGVYHPRKPGKIRVVFDCSLKYRSISLNNTLLSGPDLMNSLLGVILRFRQDKVAIAGDIDKMFYQVRVAEKHRDALRYFWWRTGDLSQEPAVYRMKVHLFGAVSSPSVSTYALHQAIIDNGKYFTPSVSELALRNFYVDDFLCAVSSDGEAVQLVKEVSALCALGGFRLRKWMSNSRAVLESIAPDDRAADIADLHFETFPTERALGVTWDIQNDTIKFAVEPKVTEPTRRNILSIISAIFDPMGIASPFILTGKLLLQELCRKGVKWDTELSSTDSHQWHQLVSKLPDLKHLSISRCLKPSSDDETMTHVQIHHFSDASDKAYGTASYIRFSNENGDMHCSLLFGKSRVAPLKKITTPRMELTAACLAVKLNHMLNKELSIQVHEVFYWTDSMAVIRYIQNQATRFHTFVANRLTLIHEGSEISQWKFVDGANNPADLASRGLAINDVTRTTVWLRGPEFLWEPESSWPKSPDIPKQIPENDPELKRTSNAALTVPEPHTLDEVITKYSDYRKLKRILGYVLHFIKCLKSRRSTGPARNTRKRQKSSVTTEVLLPMDMIHEAELLLVRHVQQKHYREEIVCLTEKSNKSGVKSSSDVYRLDPFLYQNIIRVGGRLSNADLPYDVKYPILLSPDSLMATLVIRDIHKRTGHQGKNHILSELRQRFWIPRAGRIAKRIISKCVDCRRYSARREGQKMADLPADRVVGYQPPFSHVGVDYFGPFEVKVGRTMHKRYGVIFTCASSRAVHLEVAFSLTTDSCINAIRRFVARRGQVVSIRSDNGTNLVGAEAEMRREINSWNQSKIGRNLHSQNIEWNFNPPASSHFGGFWERMIRSVRRVMYSLLRDQSVTLDDESLHTIMCEIEQILNNRPLTPALDNPNDLEVLTPNHLLLARANVSLPPGGFTEDDRYVRKRWRLVQHVTNLFWTRWCREYIPLLQKRQKWTRRQNNLRVGDIVLIADNSPRNVWTMGRVREIHHDSKGLVRVVTLITKTATLQRPVHKLCLLLEAED